MMTEKNKKKKWALIGASILILLVLVVLYILQYRVDGGLLGLVGIDSGSVALSLVIDDEEVEVGGDMQVDIYVTSKEQAINAVGYEISFDSSLVEVVSTSSEGSICELFTEDIIEGNSVRYSCGLPNPGFTGEDGLVGSIQLKAVRKGVLEIIFGENTQVLANDGLGTDILDDTAHIKVVITPV